MDYILTKRSGREKEFRQQDQKNKKFNWLV